MKYFSKEDYDMFTELDNELNELHIKSVEKYGKEVNEICDKYSTEDFNKIKIVRITMNKIYEFKMHSICTNVLNILITILIIFNNKFIIDISLLAVMGVMNYRYFRLLIWRKNILKIINK